MARGYGGDGKDLAGPASPFLRGLLTLGRLHYGRVLSIRHSEGERREGSGKGSENQVGLVAFLANIAKMKRKLHQFLEKHTLILL